MDIKIRIHSENPRFYQGEYEFLEGTSRQEGTPSFMITSHNKSENAEILFNANSIDEIDMIIQELSDAKELMITDKEKENEFSETKDSDESEHHNDVSEPSKIVDDTLSQDIPESIEEEPDISLNQEYDEDTEDVGKNF